MIQTFKVKWKVGRVFCAVPPHLQTRHGLSSFSSVVFAANTNAPPPHPLARHCPLCSSEVHTVLPSTLHAPLPPFAIAMPPPRSSGTAPALKVTKVLPLPPPPLLSGLSRSAPDVVRAVSAPQATNPTTTGGYSASASAATAAAALSVFLTLGPHRVADAASAPAARRSKQPLVPSSAGRLLLLLLTFGTIVFAWQRLVVQPGLFNLPTLAELVALCGSDNPSGHPLVSASPVTGGDVHVPVGETEVLEAFAFSG
jgi:hypothetical protein